MATLRLGIDARQAQQGAQQFESATNRVNRGAQQAAGSTQRVEGSFQRLRRSAFALQGAFAALGGALALRQFVRFADTATQLESRLRLVTDTSEELASVQNRLFRISQRSRTGLEGTVELYSRVARATEDIGLSQEELLQIVETTNQAITVSGASATEANAALIQLSQGLASGALRGEELNSVLEQTPRLARAIADGAGIAFGDLRDVAAEGQLTAELVTDALLRSGAEIQREFNDVERTVEQAGTQLRNQLIRTVGEINSGTGATNELTEALDDMREVVASDEFRGGLEMIVQFVIDVAREATTAVSRLGEMKQALEDLDGDSFARSLLEGSVPGRLFRMFGGDLGDTLLGQREGGGGEEPYVLSPITVSGSGGGGRTPPPPPPGSGGPDDRALAAYGAFDAAMTAREEYAERLQEEGLALTRDLMTAQEAYNASLERYKLLRDENVISEETYRRAVEEAQEELESAKSGQDGLNDSMARFGDIAESAFERAITQGESLRDVVQGLAEDMARLVIRNQVTNPLGDAVTDAVSDINWGGFFGGGGGEVEPGTGNVSSGGLFGGFRANGGPVSAGKAYVVGERGPELFRPGASGSIAPNEALGGQVVNNITIEDHSGGARTEERRNSSGGKDIRVIVGELVAGELSRFGSAPNKAVRKQLGGRQRLNQRG